jgi:glycosyltransferase involved in cell wall biosynthesis
VTGGTVAVVLHEPELGGATTSLLRVVPELERRGWSFAFWVPGRGAAEDELRRRGHDVASAERRLRFSIAGLREPPGVTRRLRGIPSYLRSFRAWLRDHDPAVVHANTLLTTPEVAGLPRRRPPLVLHVHEMLPSGPKGAAVAAAARRADLVVAVSEAVALPLRSRGINTAVVHPGVWAPSTRAAVRRDGPLVIGTLGTVSERKGSDLFLAMAREVLGRRNGIEFRMVGDLVVGPGRPWAKAVLDRARASGVVHRSGVDPYVELPEWDVFVLPSRMDPCPLAVLEAMACGVPVVASSVGGIPEEVGDEAGLLIRSEDIEGFAAAVLRLAEQPELRETLGAAGHRRVGRNFTLARQAEGLDRAYRTVLAHGG